MVAESELSIEDRIERLETIAERLEEGEVGLDTAKELREEADNHLEGLRDELDIGKGDIIEINSENGVSEDTT